MTETVLSRLYTVPGRTVRTGITAADVAFDDGTLQRQHVHRWLADPDAAETRLLDRCDGPTLDLGCGPGRLVAALARRGVPALGVDVSEQAVAMTRTRGAAAVCRDLFAPLPAEGRWTHALLLDGNVGIGGDPEHLLRRVAELLTPRGVALVETASDDVDRRGQARLRLPDGTHSRPFPWAVLGAPALGRVAAATGWRVADRWTDGGRSFAALRRPEGAQRERVGARRPVRRPASTTARDAPTATAASTPSRANRPAE